MNCNIGTAAVSATVKVEGSAVDALCIATGCDAPNARAAPCLTPTIKRVIYTSPLEPSEEFIVSGCGFGELDSRAPRKLILKGAFPTAGTSVTLKILTWSETAVMAKVPPLGGVLDQTGFLQVEAEPKSSNQVSVNFRATRQFSMVNQADVVSFSCPPITNVDVCDLTPTFKAFHVNTSNKTVSGVDVLTFKLANGWEIYSGSSGNSPEWRFMLDYPALFMSLDRTTQFTADASGIVPGASAGALRGSWTLAPGTYVTHTGGILIRGPAGVPHN